MKLSRDLFFTVGRPFSPIYSLFMIIRERLYSYGVFSQYKLQVPVVSVGNLTMGGTGKTPTVAFVATFLRTQGFRPAVISRGYGGKAKCSVNLVSDGINVLLDAQQAGDEPYMLARQLPGIPVLTGKKRVYPCRFAIDQLHCNILILDDGFQHLAIVRDIDLVLFNATTLAGNSRVFPGGELREPVSALKRCTAFLLTGIDASNQPRATRFAHLLQAKYPEKPIFFTNLTCSQPVEHAPTGARTSGNPPFLLYAFCGIAHPERFRATLAGEGLNLAGFSAFSDHQTYTQKFLDQLVIDAKKAGATGLITTEKDLVKIEGYTIALPLFTLKTAFVPGESFAKYLREIFLHLTY